MGISTSTSEMSRSSPLIKSQKDFSDDEPDPYLPSSTEPSGTYSSPPSTAPITLATSLPNATQPDMNYPSSAISASSSPQTVQSLAEQTGCSQDHNVNTQTSTSLLSISQEDLLTPKVGVSVDQDGEMPSPKKKKSNEKKKITVPSSKKALFTTRKKRQSKSYKAGLVMSVARVLSNLKNGQYSKRVGVTGAVYLAAVLEYLVAEVLELAGNCATFFKKRRVTPRCIQLSLLSDKELAILTKGTIVPEGGVKPHIHPFLLPKSGGEGEDQDLENDLL